MIIETKALIYSIGTIIGIFLTFLGIDIIMFELFLGLLFIDFITGFIKGLSLKTATSKKVWLGFLEKGTVMLVLLSVGILIQILGMNPLYWIGITFTALSLGEFYSILGNIYTIHTKKVYKSEFNAIVSILEFFMGKTKKELEKIIKPEEKIEDKSKEV